MSTLFVQMVLAHIRMMVIANCTPENIQKVLQSALDSMKQFATKSATTLDDWALEVIEKYVNTKENAEALAKLINGFCEDPRPKQEETKESVMVCEIEQAILPALAAWKELAK